MKNFNKATNTIDSREVAKMVKKSHAHLLRDIGIYCNHLTETNFGLSEFFQESTYTDSTGRTLLCYQITRKGCEFIANKLTGKKGTLFTAAYINRFHELEQLQAIPQHETTKAFSVGEVASMVKTLTTSMRKQGSDERKVAKQIQLTCQQFGIEIIPDFIEPEPPHTQLQLAEMGYYQGRR